MSWLLLVLQLAQWEPVKPPTLHQGFWETCGGAERVLEHRVNGKLRWELHMGPDDEFALYDHEVNGEDHTHDSPDNLLAPGYRVRDVQTWRGKRNWNIPRLRLWVSIAMAGEPEAGCESFYIRIERK